MSRRSLLLPVALAAALMLAACGGSATTGPDGATRAPGGATQAPGATTPALPSVPGLPSIGGSSQLCQGIPTFSPQTPQPSFRNDPDLVAKFPTTVGGQPTSNVQTFFLIDFLCVLGGTGVDQAAAAMSGLGLDLRTISAGTFDVTVGENSYSVSAIRTPGQDAKDIIQKIGPLTAALGSTEPFTGTFTNASFGGKTIIVSTDADGAKTYIYPAGDTLFTVSEDSITDDDLNTIFGALP